MTPILTANMSNGQGSTGLVSHIVSQTQVCILNDNPTKKAYLLPPTFITGVMQPLALLCPLHFTSLDNDPYPTANMSNGQGSNWIGFTDH